MTDCFSIYYDEIRKIPLLSVEEEIDIGKKAFSGNIMAREKLVQANLRFVVMQAHKFMNQGLDFEDLICEGNAGLLYAATKFDPAQNVRFTSYAVWCIRQYMIKAIYEVGQNVRIPIGNSVALNNTKGKFISLDKVVSPVGSDKNTLADIIEDVRSALPEDELLNKELLGDIKKASRVLSALEKTVLSMRYGFDDGEKKSLLQVGYCLGYSKERIRQIENRALEKLKPRFLEMGYVA